MTKDNVNPFWFTPLAARVRYSPLGSVLAPDKRSFDKPKWHKFPEYEEAIFAPNVQCLLEDYTETLSGWFKKASITVQNQLGFPDVSKFGCRDLRSTQVYQIRAEFKHTFSAMPDYCKKFPGLRNTYSLWKKGEDTAMLCTLVVAFVMLANQMHPAHFAHMLGLNYDATPCSVLPELK